MFLFYISGVTSVNHRNFVSKFIRPVQATWHPQSDDVMLVGCTERPRRVCILLFSCLLLYLITIRFFVAIIFRLIYLKLPPGSCFILSMDWILLIRLLSSILLYRYSLVEILPAESIFSALKITIFNFFSL